ncbi:MAG: ATP-binding protein [Syntrophaceae bacterium]|nr:ATP-binding protein [Syntrophaceae bacterium]
MLIGRGRSTLSEKGLFEREKSIVAEAKIVLDRADKSEDWVEHYKNLLDEYERLIVQSDRLLRIGDIMQTRLNTLREELRLEIENHRKTQAEKEKFQAQLSQAQKMEALGTLVGGIAHDINNMLQSILGFSELLLREKQEDDPSYKRLQTIIKAGKGGADLVKKLLTFSQQAATFPVNLDLNDQITEILTLMSHSIPSNVNLYADLCKEAAITYADPSQVDEIIMNLVSNAVEAMPTGGDLKISTRVVLVDDDYDSGQAELRHGAYVLMTVSDTGRGMDESTISKIFDPFFSTKQKGSSRGTGLGLSVVKGIVDNLGGHITCESSTDRGTYFNVYFPITEILSSSR